MGRQEQIVNERLRKLKELKQQGINPYPHKYEVKHNSKELQEKYKNLKKGQKKKDKVNIAGRIISVRDLGKIMFCVVQDGYGKIQVVLQDKETPIKSIDFFKKYADVGDFFGFEGTIWRTDRGELSILVKKAELLSKSIYPLPEKWHGLQDEEERYRKRYLDLITNPTIREVFEKRAKILDSIREFMKENNFIEIETPILQPVYGGAMAKPFKTHIEAYNTDIYLSIAPELPLKKALVGGFDRVYEITKKFRNEGVDRSHNPEHMTIEWYQSYANYEDGMDLFESLIKKICKDLYNSLVLEYQGHKINLKKWRRLPLFNAIKEYLGEDISKINSHEKARQIAQKHGIDPENITKSNLADELMKLFRHKLIQPTFLIDYPIGSSPLAKPKESDPTKVEVFQPFIGGLELARAYSELNDPHLQEENFAEQMKERREGNMEAMPLDIDFVDSLKYGMPPACGVGVGIERVIMLFTNQTSIRDVILFPFMKPLDSSQNKKSSQSSTSSQESAYKLPISRDEAWQLVKRYNKDKADLNHYLESEAVMRAVAKKLGRNQDYWGMLGLIHDIDWGITKDHPKDHLTKAPKILKDAGFDEEFIQIVLSHGYGFDCADLLHKKRSKEIEYALACSETVTGLIHAYARMKPIEQMDVSGLKKKFKDKKFVAAVRREIIEECKNINLSLDEFLQIAIDAIRSVSDKVDLSNSKDKKEV